MTDRKYSVTDTVVAMTDRKMNIDKRMNAVGDPDGNSSDDDESSSSSEEIENDLEEFIKKSATQMKDATQRLLQGIMLRNNNKKKNDQQYIRHPYENHPDPDGTTIERCCTTIATRYSVAE
jgi:hypothetical protein